MDLGDLKNKVAPLTFELDGETVNAKFYPHKLTPEDRARLQKLADEDETRDTDAQMLCTILESWDVTANGEPYPPTYENLLVAPQTLVTRTALEILSAVGKLASPKTSKR